MPCLPSTSHHRITIFKKYYRCYVYHSQMGGKYGIVLTTLVPLLLTIRIRTFRSFTASPTSDPSGVGLLPRNVPRKLGRDFGLHLVHPGLQFAARRLEQAGAINQRCLSVAPPRCSCALCHQGYRQLRPLIQASCGSCP